MINCRQTIEAKANYIDSPTRYIDKNRELGNIKRKINLYIKLRIYNLFFINKIEESDKMKIAHLFQNDRVLPTDCKMEFVSLSFKIKIIQINIDARREKT